MHRIFFALATLSVSLTAFASDERAALASVKKYSEAIACNIPDVSDVPQQYRIVTLVPGDVEVGGLGAIYVVHWIGDVGCAGGTGTATSNFTVAELRGMQSASPVVVPGYTLPELDLAQLTGLSARDGVLHIQGLAYGPDDQMHQPQRKVSYALKFDHEKGIFTKR